MIIFKLENICRIEEIMRVSRLKVEVISSCIHQHNGRAIMSNQRYICDLSKHFVIQLHAILHMTYSPFQPWSSARHTL